MRSCDSVPVIIDNIRFQGRTGIAYTRQGKTSLYALDAISIDYCENAGNIQGLEA